MKSPSHQVISEVAALREHILLLEQAAQRSLVNGAIISSHEHIAHNTHKELSSQLGHDEAMQVIFEQIGWSASDIAAGASPALAPEETSSAAAS